MYPIMPSLRCTHVSHHTADMVSAAAGSDHEITSSCNIGIRVHATTPARHQACENEMRPDSDRCRRSGHLSDNDICPTAVILVSDKCRCRTNVAQSLRDWLNQKLRSTSRLHHPQNHISMQFYWPYLSTAAGKNYSPLSEPL